MNIIFCVFGAVLGLSLHVDLIHAMRLCTRDSDCLSTECCNIMSHDLIVSEKRQETADGNSIIKRALANRGFCESHITEGNHCSLFGKRSIRCRCQTGLSCQIGISGYYQCTKHDLQIVS